MDTRRAERHAASTMDIAPHRARCSILLFSSLVLLLATSCTNLRDWKRLERPWTTAALANEKEVHVLRVDRPSVTVRHPRVETLPDGPAIVGVDANDRRSEIYVPLEHVSALEVLRVDAGRIALVVLVVAILATGALTIGASSRIGTLF